MLGEAFDYIENWEKATVADMESDGLLDTVSKIHILGFQMQSSDKINYFFGEEKDRIVDFFKWHEENKIPVVFHNGIGYDKRVFEKLLGIDLSGVQWIDTYWLSFYLNIDKERHGIEALQTDYPHLEGKFGVDEGDWKTLTKEQAVKRVVSDVEVGKAIWEDFKSRLIQMHTEAKKLIDSDNVVGAKMSPDEYRWVEGLKSLTLSQYIGRTIGYISSVAEVVAIQEDTGWEVDVEYLTKHLKELEVLAEASRKELESVMPEVPQYANRKEPAKPYKKDGTLSASGERWKETLELLKSGEKDGLGNVKAFPHPTQVGVVRVLNGYKPPNINSPNQVKDFLFSKGWNPQTYEFVRDKEEFTNWIKSRPEEGSPRNVWTSWMESRPEERAIPQVKKDGELCPSVEELARNIPEVKVLEEYSVITHRIGVLKGILESVDESGKVKAGAHGLTSTLRLQHRRPIVNLPSVKKLYAAAIRGSLVAGKGRTSVGADLSSLEDRVKIDLMMPHDPELAERMSKDDFDPHIEQAIAMGLVTKEDGVSYTEDCLSEDRRSLVAEKREEAKPVNYLCLPKDTTEVLTDKGWKFYKDLEPNDKVMSYNVKTGMNEFCKILKFHEYKDVEVINMKSRSWELESTKDHRWLSLERKWGDRKRDVLRFRTTESLTTESKILASAPYVGGKSKVKPEEAALVAWILSDGSLSASPLTKKTSQGKNGERRGVKATVSQSEKYFIKELKDTVKKVGVEYSLNRREDGVNMLTFRSESFRRFWTGVGLPVENKHDINYTEWLLSLSKESLKAFFEAFYLADGLTSPNRKYTSRVVYQKEGNICDAIQLCSELLGINTYVCRAKNSKRVNVLTCRKKPILGMQTTVREYSRNTDVFCLTTENGTFVIRQKGFISITGNCAYGGTWKALQRQTGWSKERCEEAIEAYWKANWSIKAIAEEQVAIKDYKGRDWIVSPLNGLIVNLRSEKDRFNAVAQSGGAFYHFNWIFNIINIQKRRWGRATLTANIHDEVVLCFKDENFFKDIFERIITDALEKVNNTYKPRRRLDCEVQFGYRYSEIH